MDLLCPHCHGAIATEDVDPGRQLAKCGKCHGVLYFEPLLARSFGGPAPRRPPVAMPEGLTLLEEGDTRELPSYRSAPRTTGRLVLCHRWYRPTLVGMLGFCIFWNGFLIVWYWLLLGMDDPPLTHVIFPIIHVVVGLAVTYGTLAGFVNKTLITVTREAITIRHGPLPWRGNRVLPAGEVRQLFCHEHVARDKQATHSYSLSAITRDEERLVLLRDLPTPFHALFIEQRVEDHLDISDEPVSGELGG